MRRGEIGATEILSLNEGWKIIPAMRSDRAKLGKRRGCVQLRPATPRFKVGSMWLEELEGAGGPRGLGLRRPIDICKCVAQPSDTHPKEKQSTIDIGQMVGVVL